MTSPTSHTPRRRWGRVLLMLVLGACGLLLAIVALLPYVLSLDSVKRQIVAQAEAQLNRDVELGQVRLQILTGLGAGLEHLTIANPPGWQSPYFVKIDTLSVKLALMPLLQRRIEVSKIILHDGEIVVERDEQGRMNYEDLTASAPAPQDNAPAPAPSPREAPETGNPLANLLVSHVALRHVDLTFVDRMLISAGEARTTRVQDVQVDMKNIGLNTPIDFDFAASFLAEDQRNLRLNGQIGPVPSTLDFNRVPLHLDLNIETLPLGPLQPYMGSEPLLNAGNLKTALKVRGTLGEALDLDGDVSLTQAVLADTTGTGQPTPLPDINLQQDATVDMARASIDLTQVLLDVAAVQTTVNGIIEQFKTTPHFDLRLGTNTFAIGDVLGQLSMLAQALPSQTRAQGQLQLQATAQGSMDNVHTTADIAFQNIDVQMANGTRLTLPQGQLAHDIRVDMTKHLIQLAKANLDLNSMKASLKGTVQQFDTAPRLALQWQTNRFAAAEVLALAHLPALDAALPEPTQIQGHLALKGAVEGPMNNLTTDLQVASDTFAVKSGTFNGASSGDGLSLDLANLQSSLKAHIRDNQPADANLTLNIARLNLDQQTASTVANTPPSAPAKKPGSAGAKGNVPGTSDTSSVPPVNLQGKVAIATGQIKKVPFQNLRLDVSMLNGLLKTVQRVDAFEGTVQSQFQANLAQPKPDFTVRATVDHIRAGNLVNTFTSVPNILFGSLDTSAQFAGKGFDWEAISSTLSGAGKFQIDDFKLTTLDLMPKLAQTLSAVSAISGLTVPRDLATRSFDRVKGSVRVANGNLRSDDLKLWGPDVELMGKAVLGLDQSLNFDGTVVLMDKLANALGKPAAFLKNQRGQIALPLSIRGTVTRPQVAISEKYVLDLVKQALAKNVQDQGVKQLQNLLEKQLPKSEKNQAPAQDQKANDPINELNKALQGLFKR